MSRLFRSGLRQVLVHGGPLPRWLIEHPRRSYIEAQALAGVPWADRVAIRRLEEDRDFRALSTGVPHVLDHELPLVSRFVCGLTVDNNLRVVPAGSNAKKSNAIGITRELFDQPEQLRMI